MRERLARGHWYLLPPLAITLIIGAWGISNTSLWFDERVTSEAAHGPLANMWEAPLVPYYSLIWIWTIGGKLDTDVWLRAFSVLCMLLAVLAIALAAYRIAGKKVGFVAGMVMALAPGVARYSQEARSYALATCLVSLSILAFVQAQGTRSKRAWALYAACLVATGIFAPFALISIAAFATLVLASREYRSQWKPWLLSTLLVIPVLIPQIVAAHVFAFMHSWVPSPALAQLPQGILWSVSFPDVTQNDWTPTETQFGLVLVVLALLTGVGLRWLTALLTATLVLWIGSNIATSFWIVRSMLPLSGMLAIAAAIILGRLSWTAVLLMLVLLALLAFPQWKAARTPGAKGYDGRSAAKIVTAYALPGDVISTTGKNRDGLAFSVRRYSPRAGEFTYADSSNRRIWVLDPTVECTRLGEWDVPGNEGLVLCNGVASGWEVKE